MSKIWVFLGIILLLASGCYTTRFYSDMHALRPVHDGETRHVSTLLATTEISEATRLRPLCPSGISKLEIQQTLADGVLHYMTLGFYSPFTVKVWCKRRKR